MNSSIEKETMKSTIDRFLVSEANKVSLENVSPNEVVDYMKTIGYEDMGIESNGWQWDYWIEFNKEDKSYTLSGSGYYGDMVLSENDDKADINVF